MKKVLEGGGGRCKDPETAAWSCASSIGKGHRLLQKHEPQGMQLEMRRER